MESFTFSCAVSVYTFCSYRIDIEIDSTCIVYLINKVWTNVYGMHR